MEVEWREGCWMWGLESVVRTCGLCGDVFRFRYMSGRVKLVS